MKILVTGGAGYIGSHTLIELIESSHEVVVIDNFCNSSRESIRRVEAITQTHIECIECDILDRGALIKVFIKHHFDAVIHFAGLKSVGESVDNPIRYFNNNISGTLTLCDVMADFGVKNMVFSSSATVYGKPKSLPIDESFPTSTCNPYGKSKLAVEELLSDIAESDKEWNITLLRYFNPVGAHKSGIIGEDPKGIPNNILPYISQVAIGRLERLGVFGSDYNTIDGTGVRDYIHVVDLAKGHVKAIQHIIDSGLQTYNLGTGKGYSVFELIAAFQKASGVSIPFKVLPRRSGDVAACYSCPALAENNLGWKAELNIDDMMQDSWRWQSNNPDGYNSSDHLEGKCSAVG